MKKVFFTAGFLLVSLGCERDFGFESFQPTSGYRVEGRVTDRIGNPVTNVSVKVFYVYDPVDNNAAPSKEYNVTDTSKTITAVVRDRNGGVVRTLYTGKPPQGTFIVQWNQKDSAGNDVPSSTYSVHYLADGVSQKSYPVTVDGTAVTATDSLGAYAVPDKNLPVGFYPVPIYGPDGVTYYGNHRITATVRLTFVISSRITNVYVALTKDRVTYVDVIMG